MRRFDLGSRGDVVGLTALCLLVGGLFVVSKVLWAIGLLPTNGKPSPETSDDWLLVALQSVLGLIVLGIGWWFARQFYAVDLDPEGSLRFVRLLGTTSIAMGEILEVDIFMAKIPMEGSDPRKLRVRHTRGTVVIPYSPHLVVELRRRVVVRELPSRTG